LDEETHVLAHDSVERPVLHKEPEPLNRVEVGRIERFEVVPLRDFFLCQEALSRIKRFRFRVKVRPLSASSGKA